MRRPRIFHTRHGEGSDLIRVKAFKVAASDAPHFPSLRDNFFLRLLLL
jgi:hypothetical protein